MLLATSRIVLGHEMNWTRIDANGASLQAGDLVVGDTGKVYRLADEQYATGGDFIRVNYVNLVRGRWLFDHSDIHGQHATCVVKITSEQLDQLGYTNRSMARSALIKYFQENKPSLRQALRDRKRGLQEIIERRRSGRQDPERVDTQGDTTR